MDLKSRLNPMMMPDRDISSGPIKGADKKDIAGDLVADEFYKYLAVGGAAGGIMSTAAYLRGIQQDETSKQSDEAGVACPVSYHMDNMYRTNKNGGRTN